MKQNNLSHIRNEYRKHRLDKEHVDADPLVQFGVWMKEAMEGEVQEPTAMTLATVSTGGRPSARIVLLKGFDKRGFTFFTNYSSRKGTELEGNPYAALVFFWVELERQIRIEGRVEQVAEEESDIYFTSRPEESRISAIISPQSAVVPDRAYLEGMKDSYLKEHQGPHARPANWGGYCLVPDSMEFWQGRPGRLHDRIRYTMDAGVWKIERLAP